MSPDVPPPEQRELRRAVLQGNCLEVKTYKNYSRGVPTKERGAIKGFTNKARLRMLKTLARIDWGKVSKAVFVTLTYPDAVVDRSYGERTKDRSLFFRYAEKTLRRQVGAIWRTEWQIRKSGERTGELWPHHHFVLLGVDYLDGQDVRDWWRRRLEVVGPLATDVQGIDQAEHVAGYVAKYAAKRDVFYTLDNGPYLNTVGRSWGLARIAQIPWHTKHTVRDIPADAVELLGEVVRERMGYGQAVTLTGYTILGPDAAFLAAKYLGIGGTQPNMEV